MHVPALLQVGDHIGQDTSREILLTEVLALTQLNWNSAALGRAPPPITIRFSSGSSGRSCARFPVTGSPLPRSSSFTSDQRCLVLEWATPPIQCQRRPYVALEFALSGRSYPQGDKVGSLPSRR